MKCVWASISIPVLLFTLSCGQNSPTKINDPEATNEVRTVINESSTSDTHYHVKGTWSAKISHGSDGLNLSKAHFAFKTSSNVAKNLKFNISDEDFLPPSNPVDGILSFGKFSLEKLRDNHLKICGDSEEEKCQFAAIRIYTVETPGEGYWNEDENYGLPIQTGELTVPHLKEQALIIEEIDISKIRVLKLKHFSDLVKNIPISIDFSDAVFGEYKTEIVIDYILY